VTGSTSGIGLGIARALAAAGANVVLNGFGPADEIARTKEAIEADHGVKAIYSAADMTSPDAIGEMVAATLGEFGRLDVLVNNAGIQHVAIDHWNCVAGRRRLDGALRQSRRNKTDRHSECWAGAERLGAGHARQDVIAEIAGS
jgi:NAD(P)-dependent dehydrogenase (short-subunit alcohol dehydrogenase family)